MTRHHAPGFLRLVDAARARIRELTIHDVKRRLDAGERFQFVDVREESEWAVDRCARAVHLGKGVIERDVEAVIPDRTADIVLYAVRRGVIR